MSTGEVIVLFLFGAVVVGGLFLYMCYCGLKVIGILTGALCWDCGEPPSRCECEYRRR